MIDESKKSQCVKCYNKDCSLREMYVPHMDGKGHSCASFQTEDTAKLKEQWKKTEKFGSKWLDDLIQGIPY